MRILLLGTFEVLGAKSQPVPLGSRMMPLLLARLALTPQTPVTTEVLLHDLWDGHPPSGGNDTLRRLISRTRARLREFSLDAGPISTDRGFKLDLPAANIDVYHFEEYVHHGTQALSAGSPTRALELFDEARLLWRGAPLTGIAADFAEHEARRLTELHRQMIENHLSARAQLGETTTLVADLQDFCRDNPTREHGHALYFRLLAAMGERAQALRLYERLRHRLSNELGTDPSLELQAVYTELLRDPPRSITPPSRKKSYLTQFFGREAELTTISQLFTQTRLVTIVGSGGIGKTRLASEYIAHNQNLRSFFIDLAAVSTNDNVVNAIATHMGIADQFTGLNPTDRLSYLASFLAAQPTLMVLDNCEHIIDSVADVSEKLLSSCPSLKILSTSRQPLAIIGEAVIRIAPLSANSAVAMFKAIATIANPQADLEHETVAKICRQLEGIPLAIELTAARIRTMTAAEITVLLEHSFHIVAHTRQRHNRHSTLHAVLEWTWQLLEPAEQELAARLSVLSGGITIDSAAALLGNKLPSWEMSQLLHSLADKSLLHTNGGSIPRWRFLSPIRFYLAERLAADPQTEHHARLAAAQYFSGLAHRLFPQLVHGNQILANRSITAEMDNFITSLQFAQETGLTELGAQLTLDLSWYWALHLCLPELEQWIINTPWELDTLPKEFTTAFALFTAALVPESQPTDSPLTPDFLEFYPIAIFLKTKIYNHYRDRDQALIDIHIAMTHTDPWIQAAGEVFLGQVAQNQANPIEAQHHYKKAHAQFLLLDDAYSAAGITMMLAEGYSHRGEHDQAIAAIQTAVTLQKTLGFNSKALTDNTELGTILIRAGKTTEAKQHFLAILEENQAQYHPVITMLCRLGLTQAALATGDIPTAEHQLHCVQQETRFRFPEDPLIHMTILLREIELALAKDNPTQAQEHFHTLWNKEGLAAFTRHLPETIEHAAQICHAKNRPEVAAELLGAATAMRGTFDYGNPNLVQLRANLTTKLGLASFDKHYDHGRSNANVCTALDDL